MPYFIYILYSEKSDKYYIGQTTNVDLRWKQHNTSEKSTYTSKHRPWVLKGVFSCGNSLKRATQLERFIKHKKIRNLLNVY